jgi:WXG100 family type VII secretion target
MSNGVIKIVAADFQTAYSELEVLRSSLDEYRVTLEHSYAQMRASWHGASANAFEERAYELFQDYRDLIEKMKTTASDIKKVGDQMQAVDEMLGNLSSWLSEFFGKGEQ